MNLYFESFLENRISEQRAPRLSKEERDPQSGCHNSDDMTSCTCAKGIINAERYSSSHTTSFSGKALHMSARQCQTTLFITTAWLHSRTVWAWACLQFLRLLHCNWHLTEKALASSSLLNWCYMIKYDDDDHHHPCFWNIYCTFDLSWTSK